MESRLASSFLVCWAFEALLGWDGTADAILGLAFVDADLAGDVLVVVLRMADGEALAAAGTFGEVFFLSLAFAAAFAAPGLAALTVVFFFLAVGLLSVDPVDDFRLSGAFLAAAVDAATAAIAAAVAGLTPVGLEAVGRTGLGGMVRS